MPFSLPNHDRETKHVGLQLGSKVKRALHTSLWHSSPWPALPARTALPTNDRPLLCPLVI